MMSSCRCRLPVVLAVLCLWMRNLPTVRGGGELGLTTYDQQFYFGLDLYGMMKAIRIEANRSTTEEDMGLEDEVGMSHELWSHYYGKNYEERGSRFPVMDFISHRPQVPAPPPDGTSPSYWSRQMHIQLQEVRYHISNTPLAQVEIFYDWDNKRQLTIHHREGEAFTSYHLRMEDRAYHWNGPLFIENHMTTNQSHNYPEIHEEDMETNATTIEPKCIVFKQPGAGIPPPDWIQDLRIDTQRKSAGKVMNHFTCKLKGLHPYTNESFVIFKTDAYSNLPVEIEMYDFRSFNIIKYEQANDFPIVIMPCDRKF